MKYKNTLKNNAQTNVKNTSLNNIKHKNGQVSIFIVIGIILIVVVTFLISNSNFELFESKETKLINQVTDIVDFCIQKHAEQGLFILGIQGGTIQLSQAQLSIPRNHIDLGFKIPSWELGLNQVPTISSMQTQLNEHIQDSAQVCIISNLDKLSDIFEFQDFQELQIESKINQNNVVIESNFPITFSQINSESVLSTENYFLKLENNNLGDLYKLAVEIYSTETRNDILSNLVLDQIYSAGDYSTKNSMPTEGFSFSCAKRVWTKTQLKSNLVNLNNNNFKLLHFEGTMPIDNLYDVILNDETFQEDSVNYYKNFYTFTLEDTSSSFKNYKVEISMPTTQSTQKGNYFQKDRFRNFEVTPSDGELVQSTDMKIDVGGGKFGLSIPIPCVQLFHHLYTLDYDLLVKITDYSEDGNKNIFQFPLRVEINNNAPSSETPFTLPQTTQNTKLTATDTKFCAPENRMREELIYVVDKNTDETLDNANVTYECVALSCNVGSTSRAGTHGVYTTAESSLKTNLPYCVGGTLTAKKEGYFSTKTRLDTNPSAPKNTQGHQRIELISKKSFQLNENSIFVSYPSSGGGKRIETEDDGMMFISIKNKEYDFSSQGLWPTEIGVMDTLEFLEIEDIIYEVSVVLTNSDSELIGIFELKNWTPQIHNGNSIKIIIPATMNELKEENFIDFYEISNKLVKGELNIGGENYGISFE
ncbi:MAG: hypothetical protein HRU03_02380 [Nanoarchaeales archaeon]|nr:hypothetical protein [Nanoarchaeales archaeon]